VFGTATRKQQKMNLSVFFLTMVALTAVQTVPLTQENSKLFNLICLAVTYFIDDGDYNDDCLCMMIYKQFG